MNVNGRTAGGLSGTTIDGQTDGTRATVGDVLPFSRAGAGMSGEFMESVSWTPTLAFGGASTGITYSTQVGNATRCGPFIIFDFNVVLSSKGSATGAATLTMPGTATAACVIPLRTNIAATVVNGRVFNTDATLAFENASGSAGLTDTNFANTTSFRGSGVLRVA